MRQYWLVVGSQRNWEVAFEYGNIWGLKDFREMRALWNMMNQGDGLLFYVSKPVHGIVGLGFVRAKFKQTKPLWPQELKKAKVIWPLRFEFDVEHCLPMTLWESRCYTSQDLQMVTRMVFQCYPIAEVEAARKALGLNPLAEREHNGIYRAPRSLKSKPATHIELKNDLLQIGQIQGYIAEEEYRLENTFLDVVWRRVQRSVPTFVFEVQVGGDIYHAMAKLKHAYDLWNSCIFLVADLKDKAKYQALLAGTFHEIKNRIRFVGAGSIKMLIEKKKAYKDMEHNLGILPK